MNETLYIVMPAYNEEANIENVIKEWYPILNYGSNESKLIVADGGSKDQTLEILYGLRDIYPKLEVMSEPNTDHGTKVILLFKYAIKQGAEWIFQTDSDGQTLPTEFEEFWKLRDRYDAIIGNRRKRGDGFQRKIVENVLRLYVMFFFGVLVPDANAPFRLMKSDLVLKYLNLMPVDFNLPNAVLCACFGRYHDNVKYLNITFRPRQGGKNYINMKRIVTIGYKSIYNFLSIKRNMRDR